MITRFYIIFLFVLSHSAFTQEKTQVLLISFDGFRHDYVEKFNAPNFKTFIKNGTSARSLVPSFPSKTFPNHYSIITGLYPGHHGLISNSFYDSKKGVEYGIRNRKMVEDPFYYGGMPLWQLTQKNGYKSASYFWVGSEAPIQGSYPDFYKIYDGKVDNYVRIDTVISWLKLPKNERPLFTSLYFDLVDTQGHRFGPNSVELKEAVLEADKILGYLMSALQENNLNINVIISSDHGMQEVNTLNQIDYQTILNQIPTDATVVENSIISFVHLPKNKIEPTYQKIKSLENNFNVFEKVEMPKKWHFNEHYRIGDLVLLANPGYAFKKVKVDEKLTGEHGYDPYTNKNMHGILYAQGPNIAIGKHTKSIKNVDIYPLITKLLGFENPAIDGKFKNIKQFYLKK
jgi:ectonucleotide pyrophosphatase/phosphodiesterase family member 4